MAPAFQQLSALPSSTSTSPSVQLTSVEPRAASPTPGDKEMLSIRNSVSALILRSSENQQLVQGLKELETGCSYLLQISPHYDLSIETPGNGVRSFVKLVHGFLKQLEHKSSRPSYNGYKKQADIVKSVSLMNTLIQLLHLIEEKRVSVSSRSIGEEQQSSVEIVNQANWSIDQTISSTLLSLDRESTTAFLSMKPFWLSPSLKLCDELYSRLIALRVRPLHTFLSLVHPRKVVEGNVDFTLNSSVNDLRNTWSFYGWNIMRPYVALSTGFKPKIRKMIQIPRQDMFHIEGNVIKIRPIRPVGVQHPKTDVNDSHASQKVTCLFLHDNKFGCSPSDSLLIHLHGGGHVTIKPKGHEIYLRRWASRLRGVPILSVDYSLSPEHPYPAAIQEILDVYLFLNGFEFPDIEMRETERQREARMQRRSEEIISLIGFKPKNIVLCGDSAGSNLAVALMHVLQSLNELLLNNSNNNNNDNQSGHQWGEGVKIPYPRSVCLQYPYMTPTITRFAPSRLFMAFDPILPLGALFALSEAYHPQSKAHQEDSDGLDTGNGKKKKQQQHPWYRKSICNQRLREIQEANLGPFFNPLTGNFNAFRDIPLFIQVGEFDPLLDEAVSLAKKWKG